MGQVVHRGKLNWANVASNPSSSKHWSEEATHCVRVQHSDAQPNNVSLNKSVHLLQQSTLTSIIPDSPLRAFLMYRGSSCFTTNSSHISLTSARPLTESIIVQVATTPRQVLLNYSGVLVIRLCDSPSLREHARIDTILILSRSFIFLFTSWSSITIERHCSTRRTEESLSKSNCFDELDLHAAGTRRN